jgi:hypothetical protein
MERPPKKQEGKERKEEWSRREGVWRLKSYSSFWLLERTNLNRSLVEVCPQNKNINKKSNTKRF